MRTVLFLPFAALLFASSGCQLLLAGAIEASKSPSHADPFGEEFTSPNGAVGWRATLDHDHDLFPEYAHGAHNIGCGTKVEPGRLAAACPSGANIYGYQDGRDVTRMCDVGVDRETCKKLWDQVHDASPKSDGS